MRDLNDRLDCTLARHAGLARRPGQRQPAEGEPSDREGGERRPAAVLDE
jgi:hypothetical protein